MQRAHFQHRLRTNRSASALIIILVVIAIGLILSFIDFSALFPKPDPDTAEGLAPWQEWRLRQMIQTDEQQQASSEQPKITKSLEYDTNARLDNEPRGAISLVIGPGGVVGGVWYGTYHTEKKEQCDIQGGGFEGKTYPAKIYRDENGEDPSKLYFLAKGGFAFHKFKTGKFRIIGGDIYVKGWLNRDYSVKGQITITSNEKYFETFDFKAVLLK